MVRSDQVPTPRRSHLNLLIEGVPVDDQAALEGAIADRWCAVDAEQPWAPLVKPITDAGGLTRYLPS